MERRSISESYDAIIQAMYDNLDELLDVKISNEREVLDSLLLSFKLRHNIIHHILAFSMTADMTLFQEKMASYYFEGLSANVSKLTPDIILFVDKYNIPCKTIERAARVIIIDISVSTTSNLEKEKKEEKYKKLSNEVFFRINNQTSNNPNMEKYDMSDEVLPGEMGIKKVSVVGFSVNSNFSNLEMKFHKFAIDNELFIDQTKLPFTDMRLFLQALHGVQSKLKSYISNETLVENFFKKEFGKDTDSIDTDAEYSDILISRLPALTESYFSRIRGNSSTLEKTKEVLSKLDSKNKKNKEEIGKERQTEFEDICNKLNKLMTDPDIKILFEEKETTSEKVSIAFSVLKSQSENMETTKIKPTHQLYTPHNVEGRLTEFDKVDDIDLDGFKLEQRQILQIINMVSTKGVGIKGYEFVRDIKDVMTNMFKGECAQENKNMFNDNVWVSREFDEELNKSYHKYRENCLKNRTPILSEVQYATKIKHMKLPSDGMARSYKQKMIKVPNNTWSDEATTWFKKAHSGHKEEKKVRLNRTETSCHFHHAKYVDDFLDLITESYVSRKEFNNLELLTDYSVIDSIVINFLKKEMVMDFKPILKILKTTIGFNYLWNQSLCAEQLMHFTQFSLPSNTYSFFTAGSPNYVYIVNNSYHNAGKDVGKAYMIIGYVYDKRWLSPFFGNVSFKECVSSSGQVFYTFITNWRRTETFKLTFLKDQFYSVLSTSMNALLRHRKDLLLYKRNKNDKDYAFDLIKHHFSLKILVSLTSNQRIAEMLSDMRYAIMASFSDFSEIEKLVIDKFSPAYGTVMESWIATRVDNLRRQIIQFKDKENIRTFFKQPVFVQGKRKDDSIGGSFEIPSIWTGVIIKDLQDLLDDMFIYVHTLKEPSNIHHENIKAIETILEYQKKYDKLSPSRKKGNISSEEELKEFLCSDNPIGHSANVVTTSCAMTMESIRAFDLNLHAKKHFSEKVSNITSTKSAIPEYEREIVPIERLRKKKKKNKKNNNKDVSFSESDADQNNLRISEDKEKIEFMKEYEKMNKSKIKPRPQKTIKTCVTKESFLPHNNRSKVHDCMLDVLENNIDMSTIFDVAEWNILLNNARVVSDICIKAQYGAKREFYVINVGAKCNARILENIFSEICKVIPNEMISVPGDKKMLVMQDILNDCLIKKGSKQQLVFVNGDCTKWSAAETMECFMSLIEGLYGYLDLEIIRYLLVVVDMWSNKKITIPVSILQNTFFTTDDKTNYLKKDEPAIDSQQNFLQGMFNYMSSFKAVCSSNFTKDVWKFIRPNSTLNMTHLEHSDDYSLMILSDSLQEVREFRLLHRMVMRLHGFNDSVKKTNTQRFLMEFISLVSLNGHMTYPHIKKLKECGMNLGCTGFRDDIDGAMSRVGEAVRVGAILSSCYFMQKCHLLNVARSYSILPGQRNSFLKNVGELYDTPVELFGLPDTHPILSFLTKGLANNYRLLKYCSINNSKLTYFREGKIRAIVNTEDILFQLMKIQMERQDNENSLTTDDFTQGMRLYHPGYIFDVENKLIQKMKQNVKMDQEEALTFWDNHKSYNFIKPQNRRLLVQWMRAMYFKHNFALAYSRSSRSQITLRLSTFTSKNCCIVNFDAENKFIQDSIINFVDAVICQTVEKREDISEYFKPQVTTPRCNKKLTEEIVWETLKKTTMNCDSSISTLYSLFDNARAIKEREHNRSTVAALTPSKINWLNINNPSDALIQYMFNYDDFLLDNRKNKGLASLEADKREILKHYPDDILDNPGISEIKSIYTDITMSQQKKNLCMTYSSKIQNVEDFVRTHIEFGTIYKQKYSLFTSGATESINPHTGELFYKKLFTYTRNEYRLLIDDAVLVFALLKQAYKCDDIVIKKCLNNLQVKSEYQFEKNKLIIGEELWNKINIQDLKTMGCTNNELKSFAFLKNYVTNQIDDIYDIINSESTYCYQYLRVPFDQSAIVDEICEFSYSRQVFRFYLFKNKTFWITTTDKKKHLLTDAYLIGLKLLNRIKLFELEKMFGTLSLKFVQNITPDSHQTQFIKDNITEFTNLFKTLDIDNYLTFNDSKGFNRFEQISDNEIEALNSNERLEIFSKTKFFHSNNFDNVIDGKNDFINKKINIDFDQMAVFNGRRKVFSLPILQSQQSNTTFIENDYVVNGLSLNWWLDSNRIKKLIQKEDIPITKDDFDSLTDVFIKDNKILMSVKLQKLIQQMFSLPSRLFDIIPEEIFDMIEDRIGKNINDSVMTSTAIEFANNVMVKSETRDKLEQFQDKSLIIQESEEITKELMTDGNNTVELNSDSGSFNMDELDDLLDDMDDIEFEEDNPDSDDDVEDEIIKIQEQSSSGEGSSKESLINFQDFQFVMPEKIMTDVMIVKGGFAKSILESIGDPTRKVIEDMYATDIQLDMITTKEKLGLLYRLNDILVCTPVLKDAEILYALTFANNIFKTFTKSEEWVLFDDFIVEMNSDSQLEIFMKYEGELSPEKISKLLENGGKLKKQRIKDNFRGLRSRGSVRSQSLFNVPPDELESYFLIPLNRKRKIEILNQCSNSFIIDKFVGMYVLQECYKRLYKQSFVRTGFALELIEELI